MPTLTLTFDDDTYEPDTEYPYGPATPPNPPAGPAIPDNWTSWVEWYDTAAGILALGDDTGLYIIERPAPPAGNQTPVYAGKALSFANRFNGRSRALHEFGLTSAVLPHFTLSIATVTAVPAILNKVSLAESWLIRFLYAREFQAGAGPHMLQNIAQTGSFVAPAGGLFIRYDPNVAPWYLHDAIATGSANWTVVGPNSVGFNYPAGTTVIP
ncbi:MAG TPA: hypothetical protein VF715_06735 [Thermoleophilaceae bacterium]